MMDVTKLKPGRYLRMQYAKRLYSKIITSLAAGYRIQITTYAHSLIFSKPEQFRTDGYSVYRQRGKHWDCIDYCSIRAIA